MFRRLLNFVLGAALLFPTLAQAQVGTPAALQLTLSRDFGYGGFDNRIQGTFSMRVSGPGDLQRVEFYIDGELVSIDSELPFRFQFATGDFEPGEHFFYALGDTASGEHLGSNDLTRVFISAEEARNATIGIVIPLLAVVGVLGLLSAIVPRYLFRNQSVKIGDYGLAGGAVCKHCGKPFSRHFWSPNLINGKLERCPHCGKWALSPRASADRLEKAEALLRSEVEAGPGPEVVESEDDRLRRQIDESQYD